MIGLTISRYRIVGKLWAAGCVRPTKPKTSNWTDFLALKFLPDDVAQSCLNVRVPSPLRCGPLMALLLSDLP